MASVSEMKRLVGKVIEYDVIIDKYRLTGVRVQSGLLEEIKGKNALVSNNWLWIPDLHNVREKVALPPE